MNWNTYRDKHLTPNGWKYDSPGCYVHEKTGAEFHPYEPAFVFGKPEQWRVLADLDRAPDPETGHIERPRKLAEEVAPA